VPDDDQSDDTSLSEFVRDDGGDPHDGDDPHEEEDGGDPHDGDDPHEEEDGGDPDLAVSTSDYRSDGADCEACGATVERRWRDDGALVCADCKAW
jgi:hypothetical protein